MFHLEHSFAGWRRQMRAAGIKTSEDLEELESHLREDVEEKRRSGMDEPEAFATAVRQMGRAGVLQKEFFKTRITLGRRLKRLLFDFNRFPNFQLITDMNTLPSTSSLELRRTTYFKAAAFALPAAIIWMFSVIFIMPKLQQLCQQTGNALFTFNRAPAVFQAFALVGKGLFILTQYRLVLCGIILLTFGWLEWRSAAWPRYRRTVLGASSFLLNLAVLIAVTLMVITALFAVGNLPHVK